MTCAKAGVGGGTAVARDCWKHSSSHMLTFTVDRGPSAVLRKAPSHHLAPHTSLCRGCVYAGMCSLRWWMVDGGWSCPLGNVSSLQPAAGAGGCGGVGLQALSCVSPAAQSTEGLHSSSMGLFIISVSFSFSLLSWKMVSFSGCTLGQ